MDASYGRESSGKINDRVKPQMPGNHGHEGQGSHNHTVEEGSGHG